MKSENKGRKIQIMKNIVPRHFLFTSDKTIRASLLIELEKSCKKDTETKIIEELGITHGAARIDIAVVNGVIHGYELKSDKDTLNRLSSQIKIYNTVLDKVTLVVGKNHLHEAVKIIPDWWGITIAKTVASNKSVVLYNIREAEQNPQQDNIAIASLLWKHEALSILDEVGHATGVRSKNRGVIYKRLSEVLDEHNLKLRVRHQLRTRIGWRSDSQYMLCGD